MLRKLLRLLGKFSTGVMIHTHFKRTEETCTPSTSNVQTVLGSNCAVKYALSADSCGGGSCFLYRCPPAAVFVHQAEMGPWTCTNFERSYVTH